MSKSNSPQETLLYTSPIAFAQVREDPIVEINAIRELQMEFDELEISLICSGGDTICSIIKYFRQNDSHSDTPINIIHAVDLNPAQHHLTALKLALIQKYPPTDVIEILSNGIDKPTDIIGELMDRLSTENYTFWFNHQVLLRTGVNQLGRFELLFKETFSNKSIIDFDLNFSHDNLRKIFGDSAVNYSHSKPFSEHFREVYQTYLELYPDPSSNYFYHQFVNNSYGSKPDSDLPVYLQGDLVENNILSNKIVYQTKSMLNFLSDRIDSSLHLVHLSNITDWLPSSEFDLLLNEAGRVLKLRGKVILRRLNSDILLEDYIKNVYPIKGKYSFQMETNIIDKSHFYREVIVLTKFK